MVVAVIGNKHSAFRPSIIRDVHTTYTHDLLWDSASLMLKDGNLHSAFTLAFLRKSSWTVIPVPFSLPSSRRRVFIRIRFVQSVSLQFIIIEQLDFPWRNPQHVVP